MSDTNPEPARPQTGPLKNCLLSGISATAAFFDPKGGAITMRTDEIARKGDGVPFVWEGVFLKNPVPIGASFELVIALDEKEAVSFRAAIPVPQDYQDALSEFFKKDKGTLFLVSYKAKGDTGMMPQWSFHADVWIRVKVMRHGFTELELHVGKEGIGTQKWMTKTQFWTRVG